MIQQVVLGLDIWPILALFSAIVLVIATLISHTYVSSPCPSSIPLTRKTGSHPSSSFPSPLRSEQQWTYLILVSSSSLLLSSVAQEWDFLFPDCTSLSSLLLPLTNSSPLALISKRTSPPHSLSSILTLC